MTVQHYTDHPLKLDAPIDDLEEKAFEGAEIINKDPKLIAEFFNHAKLVL
jgi:hypothetical protein